MDRLTTIIFDRPLFSPDFIIIFENLGAGRLASSSPRVSKLSLCVLKLFCMFKTQ